MELKLDQKQVQTLSPQMIQSMKLLQMGTMELREYLQEQLQENPALESEDSPPSKAAADRDHLLQKLEWLHSTDVQNSWYNREDARDLIELAPGGSGADLSEESLYHHLRIQIPFYELSPVMTAAVECVLQSLTGAGRLDEPLEDLAAHAGSSITVIQEAIQLVQSLDPAGVAARDLSECLALQLMRQGETGLALTIVRSHLEDMGQDHYNLIARATGASREDVREACRLIRTLDPRPGAAFAPRETTSYIIPDLTVVPSENGFEIISNSSYMPSLHISPYYHRLMEATDDEEVREYLSAKVRQAKWVLQNVEQRRSTLMSCAQCIVARQEDFFRQGPGHLRPLSLADAAAELNIHESTVSRAIRDKYLQCSHGIFPLKYFFSRALPTAGGETDVSAEWAKTALRALIDGENKKRPLSDQKLSELLSAQGVQLSRRTVAKYRDELGIPSTAGRKEL